MNSFYPSVEHGTNTGIQCVMTPQDMTGIAHNALHSCQIFLSQTIQQPVTTSLLSIPNNLDSISTAHVNAQVEAETPPPPSYSTRTLAELDKKNYALML